MHTDYLGDALDFWKGAVLGRLGYGRGGKKLSVVPMFTVVPTEGHVNAYADLLGRPVSDVVHPRRLFSNATRTAYFDDIMALKGDVFVDPDTGVGGRTARHVTAVELGAMAAGRLVIVYQHSWRGRAGLLDHLHKAAETAEAEAGYLACGQAGLFFLSKDPGRARAVTSQLSDLLGKVAPARIHSFS